MVDVKTLLLLPCEIKNFANTEEINNHETDKSTFSNFNMSSIGKYLFTHQSNQEGPADLLLQKLIKPCVSVEELLNKENAWSRIIEISK